jgi:hypothetical protein
MCGESSQATSSLESWRERAQATQAMWLLIAAPVLVLLFNISGLPYKGAYDNSLISVSFVLNALTVWNAWKWVVWPKHHPRPHRHETAASPRI